MHAISCWAAVWILIICAVVDSMQNGNENAIGTKTCRIVFTATRELEQIRQHQDNTTSQTMRNNSSENTSPAANSIFENSIHHTQHPVKKQIKSKQFRYFSFDPNATKFPSEKQTFEDNKDIKHLSMDVAEIIHSNRTKKNDSDNSDGENAIFARSENYRIVSHHKKRRRIATSITALNSDSQTEPNDHLIPYLDFGRKLPVTVPRPLLIANSTDNSKKIVASGNDVNVDNSKRTTTSTAKMVPVNPSICGSTTYRTLRSGANNLRQKHEFLLNGNLCRWNATLDAIDLLEHITQQQYSYTNKPRSNFEMKETTETISTPFHSVTPTATQFRTKVLSTAVITSMSVKSQNKKLKMSLPLITTASTQAEMESRKKYGKVMAIDILNLHKTEFTDAAVYDINVTNALSGSYSSRITTMRPSLVPYIFKNASKTQNVNHNSQLQKLTYRDAVSTHYNVTPATTERVRTSTQNIFKPNVEYLLNMTMTMPKKQEMSRIISSIESTILESTTVWITTNSDMKNKSSSVSLSVTYQAVNKNMEDWWYQVRNETVKNSTTVNPKVFTILPKNAYYSSTNLNEQMAKPVPGVHDIHSHIGFHIATYLLAGLGVIPLVIGIILVVKMILHQNKKQIFDGSEYSSEYNRNPLEFNGCVTSSPIVGTKLPRVPQQVHWEIEGKSVPSISVPNSSQWEFPRNKLRLQTILGQGNFGQVWKAEADDISGHEGSTRLVAVKMVKEISSTREKEDLIKELVIMQHLGSHPNVVTLLGCCTEKEPYLLIMEYVMYGKLLSFLRDHRTRTHYYNFSDNSNTLRSRDLTVFAYCVARGMEYVQNKQVIHRDLAARNILIDHNKLCKIADFGMSRCVDESGQVYEHRQSKGALPIRWMAPESLHFSCYTHKTDVWSFGILMWEIITLGLMPYASMGARVVMRKVKEGYRLEKPKHCKSSLFNVISKCWYSDPNKRPSFTELKQDLLNLLGDPEYQGNYVDLDGLVDEMNQSVHRSHSEKFIT